MTSHRDGSHGLTSTQFLVGESFATPLELMLSWEQ